LPGEWSFVTRRCKFQGKDIQFAVWIAINSPRKYLSMKLTGFLVLDADGNPLADISIYAQLFQAFAIWELAMLREPVAGESVRKKHTLLDQTERITERAKTIKFKTTKRTLDKELKKTHEQLTANEAAMNPLMHEYLQLEEKIALQLKGIRESEETEIQSDLFLSDLKRIRTIQDNSLQLIRLRIEMYEYWLDLLQSKGFRLKYSTVGTVWVTLSSTLSALVTGSAMPMSGISYSALKYAIDQVSGVRALMRGANDLEKSVTSLDEFIDNLNHGLDSSIVRLPRIPDRRDTQ
jgi:hypothetical protein